ncbi:MAG: hypothetical protein M1426_02705 [Patescibacteria group bacterium]|nr:hypothetical protein [Patescibacteria group bacterium]
MYADGSTTKTISRQNFSVGLQLYLTLQYNTNAETAQKLRTAKHIIVDDVDVSAFNSSPSLTPSSSTLTTSAPLSTSRSSPILSSSSTTNSNLTSSAPLSSSVSRATLSPLRQSGAGNSSEPNTIETYGIVAVNISVLNDVWRQVTDPPSSRRKKVFFFVVNLPTHFSFLDKHW